MKNKQNKIIRNRLNPAITLIFFSFGLLVFIGKLPISYAKNLSSTNTCPKERIIHISLPEKAWLFEVFKPVFCFKGINYKFKLELLTPGIYQKQTRERLENKKPFNIDLIVVEPYLFDEIDQNNLQTQIFDEVWFKKLDDKITSTVISKNNQFYLLPFLIDLPIIVSKTSKPKTDWLDILGEMQQDIENPQYFFVAPIAKGVVATKALQMFANAFGGSFYDELGYSNYNSFQAAIEQIFKLVDYSWINQKTAIASDLLDGMINNRFQNIMVFSTDLFEYHLINTKQAFNLSNNLELDYPDNWYFEQAPKYKKKSISMFEVWSLALVADNNKIDQATLIELIKDRQVVIEKAGLVVYKKNSYVNKINSYLAKSFKTSSKPIRHSNFRHLVRKEIGLIFEAVIDRNQDPFLIINELQMLVNKHIKENAK